MLEACAVKGVCVGHDVPCPKCRIVGVLTFTGIFVQRKTVMANGPDGALHRVCPIPQCRCGHCRGVFRVLPVELLPYKIFSLTVIARHIGRYTTSAEGLRACVGQTAGDPPCFHHVASLDCGPRRAPAGSRSTHGPDRPLRTVGAPIPRQEPMSHFPTGGPVCPSGTPGRLPPWGAASRDPVLQI